MYIKNIEIEFDPVKRDWTLQHRGIDFADARYVLEEPFLTTEDMRGDYGEPRFRTVGTLNGRLVIVVWTPRDRDGEKVVRIISMRKANEREIQTFWKQLS
jgi:uncharacterized DUF497 family protein